MLRNKSYSYRFYFIASVITPIIMILLGFFLAFIEKPGYALGDIFSLIFIPLAAIFAFFMTLIGSVFSLLEKNMKALSLIIFPLLMILTFVFSDFFELISANLGYLFFTSLFLVLYACFTCLFWYFDKKH